MSFASHGGVRIYYHVEGSGRPLVLMHGFGGSSEQFSYSPSGWVAALRDHYQLIAVDARGHGKSDKPHEPEAYRMELMVGDVTAVLDDLGIRKAHYLGYSMGGGIGWGIAKYAPGRVTSLIIGGADAEDPDPDHPSEWSERMIGVLRGGREAAIRGYRESWARELRTAQKPSLLEEWLPMRLRLMEESDPEALIAMLLWWQKECLRIPEILPHLAVPCLLFVGEADGSFEGTRAASALIPHSRLVSFPGLAHTETMLRLDLVLPHILRFLSEVDSNLKE